MTYDVIVNENMYDAGARVEEVLAGEYPLLGPWERLWSSHATREEAEVELAAARDYARGRSHV